MVKEQIQGLVAQYVRAVNRGDGAALANLFAEEAKFMPPNVPMIVGRQGIEQALTQFVAMGLRELQLETVDLGHHGDVIVEVGRWSLSMEPQAGQLANDRGKDVRIWKRQADGSWKIIVDIWNSDLPQ